MKNVQCWATSYNIKVLMSPQVLNMKKDGGLEVGEAISYQFRIETVWTNTTTMTETVTCCLECRVKMIGSD